jgi:hypothetical protein
MLAAATSPNARLSFSWCFFSVAGAAAVPPTASSQHCAYFASVAPEARLWHTEVQPLPGRTLDRSGQACG